MIPTCADLASATLTHRFHDVWNPPGLTNFRGTVQVDRDLTGIRNLVFPPLSMSDFATGALFVGGKYFPALGASVDCTWRPDRVVRRAQADRLDLLSTTVMVPGHDAVIVELTVRNLAPERRAVDVAFVVASNLANRPETWDECLAPFEEVMGEQAHPERTAIAFGAASADSFHVQGLVAEDGRIGERSLGATLELDPGQRRTVALVNVVGMDLNRTLALYDEIAADVPRWMRAATDEWNAELEELFTPGGTRWSGCLPVLETSSDPLQRIYQAGALGVAYFKRESPHGVRPRAYDTLMPRHWATTTFLWDYSLSSVVHALLDPAEMRSQLEHWITTDIHDCMGTSWLSGEGLGAWYSVNDFAMTRLIRDYVRFTGDHDWLAEHVPARTGGTTSVLDYLVECARAWLLFRSPSGLADYGGIDNLLECVSSYVHEVASLNAANVFNLRVAADLLERDGQGERAAALRADAEALLPAVRELYVTGSGHWSARQPDGTRLPVRHCYDLATIGMTIADDLDPEVRVEMVDFFHRELATETWMRALSARDPDAMYSVRADHQWNGAFCAWPAESAQALLRLGDGPRTLRWVEGLARSANQGPYGQAHFTEEVTGTEAGGAPKVPNEMPFINDWACSAGGAWAALVIEGIFGVEVDLDGNVTATPRLEPFDPEARLVGLHVAGRVYDVDANGVHERTAAPSPVAAEDSPLAGEVTA